MGRDAINRSANKAARGLTAGLLTFFIGPPLGGAFLGLIIAGNHLIVSLSGSLPKHEAFDRILLLAPLTAALASFILAWAPAAAAALYVACRIGITGWMSWMETVILSVLCLAAPDVIEFFKHNHFSLTLLKEYMFLLSPFSLFAALSLRYIAGRSALTR